MFEQVYLSQLVMTLFFVKRTREQRPGWKPSPQLAPVPWAARTPRPRWATAATSPAPVRMPPSASPRRATPGASASCPNRTISPGDPTFRERGIHFPPKSSTTTHARQLPPPPSSSSPSLASFPKLSRADPRLIDAPGDRRTGAKHRTDIARRQRKLSAS